MSSRGGPGFATMPARSTRRRGEPRGHALSPQRWRGDDDVEAAKNHARCEEEGTEEEEDLPRRQVRAQGQHARRRVFNYFGGGRRIFTGGGGFNCSGGSAPIILGSGGGLKNCGIGKEFDYSYDKCALEDDTLGSDGFTYFSSLTDGASSSWPSAPRSGGRRGGCWP